MPRRRPSCLRAENRCFPAQCRYSKIDRLSGPAQAHLIQLERTRLRPGLVRQALVRWAAIAAAPASRLPSPFSDRCGVPECCPEPADERDLLEVAMCALPKKSARELRRIVQPLDLKILGRLDAMPYDARHRWWHSAF